ncbi:hypothetical protein MnTg02_01692 [bacterium MnTg02]|nr:hypothetical protein MnTg02_01692 [bacterium MnTg02]
MRKDQAKGGWNSISMQHENQCSRGNISDCHDRHELAGNGRDALDATKQNSADEHDEDNTGQPFRNGEVCIQSIGDGVRLYHVADTETGNSSEQRKGGRHPIPIFAETILDVIHRPADKLAALVFFAIMDSQYGFGKFRRHADQCGHPHPENRARAAEKDSGRDAGNVTGADSRRQGRHEGIEGADLAFATRNPALPQELEAKRDLQDR